MRLRLSLLTAGCLGTNDFGGFSDSTSIMLTPRHHFDARTVVKFGTRSRPSTWLTTLLPYVCSPERERASKPPSDSPQVDVGNNGIQLRP
jgi:hypothetical protein